MNTENTNNSAPQECTTTDNPPTIANVFMSLRLKNCLLGLGAYLITVALAICVSGLIQYGGGVVREAALLDPWFQGLPVDSYVRMTTNELGGDPIVPLGMFCGDYCCVLEDGDIVVRSSSADGSRKLLVISDYAVPEEWYGKAVILDKYNHSAVLVVDCLSADEYACYRGDVWVWSTMHRNYIYFGTGTALPCDEPAKTTTDVAFL